jgi:CRP-like cAMP-binding protein
MQSETEAFARAESFVRRITNIADDEWQMFVSGARIRYIRKKEHFLKQDQVCRYIGIITEGCVRHYYLVNGEEITNDFNFEDMVTGGYRSFSTGDPSRFNVVAMEDTTMVTFTRSHLHHLYEMSRSWQTIGRILLENIFNRKQLREESFLLETPAMRYERLLETSPWILNRVPLGYIASYLGMKQETLSRIRAKKRGRV